MPSYYCPDCGAEHQPEDAVCKNCSRELRRPGEVVIQLSEETTGVPDIPGKEPQSIIDGIIPIEPIVEQITNPTPYSLKLEVTPEEQFNARLLKTILKSEPYSDLPPQRKSLSVTILFNIVIFFMLLSAVAFQIITGKPVFPPPKMSPGTLKINQFINTLQPQAPVLVAFDYHPGFSLELEAASQSVLQQLMERKAFLYLTTTTPTGMLLAEIAINNISAKAGLPYDPTINYVNLGYIPGGAVGLSAMVSDFQSAFPMKIQKQPVTLPAEIQPVTSIQNFKLVIIITDSTETSRAWIEQVTTQVEGIPFVMISSSQVEPFLLTYYAAKANHIDAVITGIDDAVNYENFSGQYNETGSIWSQLSISILVAVGVIIAGGFLAIMFGATKPDEEFRGGR